MLATLAATLLLSQQAAIAPAKAAGPSTAVYTGVLALEVQGTEAKLNFTATKSSTKKDEGQSVAVAWTKCLLNMGGQEQDLPDMDPFTYLQKPDGTLSAFSGGIPELPAAQIVIMMHLFTNKDALETGKTKDFKVAKAEDSPAFNVTVKRLDDDKVDGESFQLFEQTVKSEGDDTLDATGKFWAKADGTLVKVEQAIKSIHVGGGGDSAKGKFTLILKK